MSTNNLEKGFLTIKEFAEFVGIKESTLRYYDKTGVFDPAKRGVKFENNYRYYLPTQITTLKMIRVLTDIGVPLKAIKELKKTRTPEKIIKLLSKHKEQISNQIHFLQETYSIINTFHDLLSESMNVIETEISIQEMSDRRIILGGINDFTGDIDFVREYRRFCNEPHKPKLNMSFPIGGYFENMAALINDPTQPTRYFSLDPKGNDRKPAGLYLVGYTHDNYGQTHYLPKQMVAYAKKNGLVFDGAAYRIYLTDEISVIEPDQYLIQISVPVKETRRISSRRPKRQF